MGKNICIRTVGDPVLKKKSEKVEELSSEILDIIEDLKETLKYSEGFGIAAPQIGINKRIVLINVDPEKCTYQEVEEIKDLILINPVWKNITEEKYSEYEGCLSVPEIKGIVERYYKIELKYLDEKFNEQIKVLSGFSARVVQHECDHLDGIVFLDKVINKGFATRKNIQKYNLKDNLI